MEVATLILVDKNSYEELNFQMTTNKGFGWFAETPMKNETQQYNELETTVNDIIKMMNFLGMKRQAIGFSFKNSKKQEEMLKLFHDLNMNSKYPSRNITEYYEYVINEDRTAHIGFYDEERDGSYCYDVHSPLSLDMIPLENLRSLRERLWKESEERAYAISKQELKQSEIKRILDKNDIHRNW